MLIIKSTALGRGFLEIVVWYWPLYQNLFIEFCTVQSVSCLYNHQQPLHLQKLSVNPILLYKLLTMSLIVFSSSNFQRLMFCNLSPSLSVTSTWVELVLFWEDWISCLASSLVFSAWPLSCSLWKNLFSLCRNQSSVFHFLKVYLSTGWAGM